MKRTVTKRTAERLVRLAYDMEALASRLRYEGFESNAGSVKDISSQLGKTGRSLMDKLEGVS